MKEGDQKRGTDGLSVLPCPYTLCCSPVTFPRHLRSSYTCLTWHRNLNHRCLTPCEETQIFQTTVSDPTADFLTPPLSSNPQPQLMNLPLISLKKEKKRKRASICSYYQVNPHTWMDGLCSWVRLASSFLEHSPTSRLCSWDLCHPLHHQFCYCYGTLWVISINTQHTNM